MPVITMSRQIGSKATDVANRLSERLGLRIFDKTLMARVANEVGLSETQIVDYSEDEYKQRSFVDALFRRSRPIAEVSTRIRAYGAPDTVERLLVDEVQAVGFVRATIQAAYERGDVLIVGRGGQAVLEGKPGVLHVRLVAPLEDRIQFFVEREQLTPPQARRVIAEHDRATAEYLRNFHHIDVDDPTLYHMVLNTGALGVDQTVAIILRSRRRAGGLVSS